MKIFQIVKIKSDQIILIRFLSYNPDYGTEHWVGYNHALGIFIHVFGSPSNPDWTFKQLVSPTDELIKKIIWYLERHKDS